MPSVERTYNSRELFHYRNHDAPLDMQSTAKTTVTERKVPASTPMPSVTGVFEVTKKFTNVRAKVKSVAKINSGTHCLG